MQKNKRMDTDTALSVWLFALALKFLALQTWLNDLMSFLAATPRKSHPANPMQLLSRLRQTNFISAFLYSPFSFLYFSFISLFFGEKSEFIPQELKDLPPIQFIMPRHFALCFGFKFA